MRRWIIRQLTGNRDDLSEIIAGTGFVVEQRIEDAVNMFKKGGVVPDVLNDDHKLDAGAVYKPSHYGNSTAIADLCEEHDVGFMLGNAIKYCFRAGKKDPSKTIEDLEKARNYIQMKIDSLKKGSAGEF